MHSFFILFFITNDANVYFFSSSGCDMVWYDRHTAYGLSTVMIGPLLRKDYREIPICRNTYPFTALHIENPINSGNYHNW